VPKSKQVEINTNFVQDVLVKSTLTSFRSKFEMKISKKIRNVLKKALSKKDKKGVKFVESLPPQSQVNEDLSDYVSEDTLDKISSQSIYLYQCEMPHEMLAKIQARRKPVYSVRGSLTTHCKHRSSSEPVGSFRNRKCVCDAIVLTSKTLNGGVKKNDSEVVREKVLASHEDYMVMDEEEPNYDDFMYFSDSSCSSRLHGASKNGVHARRLSYSCKKDPILELLPEYSRLKMTHWSKSASNF